MPRVTVHLPAPLLVALDEAVAREDRSRSDAVASAVERWCEARGVWPPARAEPFDGTLESVPPDHAVVRYADGRLGLIRSGAVMVGRPVFEIVSVGPECDPEWVRVCLETRVCPPGTAPATGEEKEGRHG